MPTINFNSALFDTLISLILIFALLSLLASSIVEMINNFYKRRQTMLYNTIGKMFEDGINPNFGQMLYNHPAILSLRKDDKSLPQYIHHETFADALIDTVCEYGTTYSYKNTKQKFEIDSNDKNRKMVKQFEDGVEKMKATPLQKMLLAMVNKANEHNDSYDNLKQQIVTLFNNQMERTTGWYKQNSRNLLRYVSFVLALFFNVNCFYLFTEISKNPDLRKSMVARAEKLVDMKDSLTKTKGSDTTLLKGQISDLNKQICTLKAESLPIGWDKNIKPYTLVSQAYDSFFSKSRDISKGLENIGLLLVYFLALIASSFIISAGSPFWFEILAKMINVRRAGIKPSANKKK